METKVEAQKTVLDTIKLLVAGAVLLGGIVGYYYYPGGSVALRALGVLVALGVAVVISLQSAMGKALWGFVQGSRVEMRKVIWPTREEAIQTTIAVLVFALIMGVFFWLLDLFLLWFTRYLTS